MRFMVLPFLREGISQPSHAPDAHANVQVLPLNVRRTNQFFNRIAADNICVRVHYLWRRITADSIVVLFAVYLNQLGEVHAAHEGVRQNRFVGLKTIRRYLGSTGCCPMQSIAKPRSVVYIVFSKIPSDK